MTFRRDGRILYVTFDRPDSLNAFAAELHDDFADFVAHVPRDEESDVIVLTGAGKAFSAGGNIQNMLDGTKNPGSFYPKIPGIKRLITDFLDIPQIVITKVNGPAMGLGATIALFGDICFAANHAKIADSHVKVGYVAGDGGAAIWPHLIGYARAKQYLLTGDILTGEEAARIGLVNFAYPADQLDAAVDAFARKLVGTPRRAVQWTKATINIALKQAIAGVLDAGAAYEALSGHTKDHKEAVTAFLEKREPRLTGE